VNGSALFKICMSKIITEIWKGFSLVFTGKLWSIWWFCRPAWYRHHGLHHFCLILHVWESGKACHLHWLTGNTF